MKPLTVEWVQKAEGDFVIIQDADLEYSTDDYNSLLEPFIKYEADVVYGSRFSGKTEKMSLAHLVGNKALTITTNILYGTKLTDMETCSSLSS